MANIEKLYDLACSFKERSPLFIEELGDYNVYPEEELAGSELVIYNKATEALGEILMPAIFHKSYQYCLYEDILDKPFVLNLEENYWSYYLKIRTLLQSFHGSGDYKLKAVEYGQNVKGSPVFLFFTQKYIVEDKDFLEMFSPLVLEIDQDMILKWFSQQTGINNNIEKFLQEGEIEKVLNRARNIGRYINIVDNYEKISLREG